MKEQADEYARLLKLPEQIHAYHEKFLAYSILHHIDYDRLIWGFELLGVSDISKDKVVMDGKDTHITNSGFKQYIKSQLQSTKYAN